jgi:hypothetical protein
MALKVVFNLHQGSELLKSVVRAHQRHLASGKVVQVAQHTDRRTKQQQEQAGQRSMFGDEPAERKPVTVDETTDSAGELDQGTREMVETPEIVHLDFTTQAGAARAFGLRVGDTVYPQKDLWHMFGPKAANPDDWQPLSEDALAGYASARATAKKGSRSGKNAQRGYTILHLQNHGAEEIAAAEAEVAKRQQAQRETDDAKEREANAATTGYGMARGDFHLGQVVENVHGERGIVTSLDSEWPYAQWLEEDGWHERDVRKDQVKPVEGDEATALVDELAAQYDKDAQDYAPGAEEADDYYHKLFLKRAADLRQWAQTKGKPEVLRKSLFAAVVDTILHKAVAEVASHFAGGHYVAAHTRRLPDRPARLRVPNAHASRSTGDLERKYGGGHKEQWIMQHPDTQENFLVRRFGSPKNQGYAIHDKAGQLAGTLHVTQGDKHAHVTNGWTAPQHQGKQLHRPLLNALVGRHGAVLSPAAMDDDLHSSFVGMHKHGRRFGLHRSDKHGSARYLVAHEHPSLF